MADKFILEFERKQIEFMAAMIHFYLSHKEDDEVALSTLEELAMQTNFVFRDPRKHGIVGPSLAPMNITTASRHGANISLLMGHLTDLSGIMDYEDLGD